MKGKIFLTLVLIFQLLRAAQPKKHPSQAAKSVHFALPGKYSTKQSRKTALSEFLLAKTTQKLYVPPAESPQQRRLMGGLPKGPGGAGGAGGGGGAGGAGGGENNKISITPPPTPQEVLPPKPIIVAPLIVRQKRKANKVMVLRHGGMWGNPMMPSAYTPGFPMMNIPPGGSRKLSRGMMPQWGAFPSGMSPAMFPGAPVSPSIPRQLYNGQQIVFNNAHTQLNEEEQSLRVTSQDNDITVSKERKTEYLENLRIQKGTEFKASLKSLFDLQELVSATRGSLISLKSAIVDGEKKLGEEISAIESLDSKMKATGDKFF
jgi:hypothetical protein